MPRHLNRAPEVVALLLLASCAPQVDDCVPSLNPDFTVAPPDVLALPGVPVTVTFTSARVPCVSDRPSVRVGVVGPDELPRQLPLEVALRSRSAGVPEAAVTLSFPSPGTWVLQAAFDPSLGAQVRRVHVASVAPLEAPRAHFALPGSCVGAPWPLDADRIACERDDATIEVRSTDGGAVTFPGAQLAVVDAPAPVLWSTHHDTLERRDARLSVTAQWPGVSLRPLAGMHDATHAIRFARDGGFVVVSPEPVTGPTPTVFTETVLAFTDAGVTADGCRPDACLDALVGLADGLRWSTDGGEVVARPVPVDVRTPARWTVRVAPLGPDRTPRPLVVMPPLFDLGAHRVHVREGPEGLVFTAWPAERLTRVGGAFVLLRADDGGIDLFPR